MSADLAEFHAEFFQKVLIGADADGQFAADEFFDRFTAELVDAGEIDTADRAYYSNQRGLRIDGYGGDPIGTGGTLNILLIDYKPTETIETLTKSELTAAFKRASNFVQKSLTQDFRDELEESGPAFGVADMISVRWEKINRVRLILMSNRLLSSRIDGLIDTEIDGKPVTQNVWDIERLWQYVAVGNGREEVSIDFEKDFGGGISILPAHFEGAGYKSFLAVVPGRQLAEVYDRWGARLLEQNVRVFLQARGNVNKGIRNTLENEPEKFFAFNNGITATAEGMTTRATPDGLVLTRLENLQIVNGGQTTASIHAAFRKKTPLAQVFVQMKLSIVEPDKAEALVPRISEYANSQNRVNAADFFSNHPYHVRMQEFSQRLFAPSPDGALRQTKWFYERARGQYQDARGKLTPANQKKFEAEYPKPQVFTKTDLAKYITVWECRPDIVSKGAQKNFAEFALFIGKHWEKNSDQFHEAYFKEIVAKAIVFKAMEKLVPEQPWYENGYRANIVAYSIAKVAYEAKSLGKHVDLMAVWNEQSLPAPLREAMIISAQKANEVLTDPPAASRNVTEWAKQQACWDRMLRCEIAWPPSFSNALISPQAHASAGKESAKTQKIDDSIDTQAKVVSAGPDLWRQVKAWGTTRKLLTEKEQGVLDVCGAMPSRIPTDKQCDAALTALRRLHSEGCRLGLELA